MRGDIADFTKKGDIFVLHVKTTQPPGWTIRAGLTYKDSLRVVGLMLRPKTLFSILFGWLKKEESPEEF
jgi:hypothetical protein